MFWVTLGGVLIAVAAISIGVAITQVAADPKGSLWSNGWFRVGIGVVIVAVLLLTWALILYFRRASLAPMPLQPRYDQSDRYRHTGQQGRHAIFEHRLGVSNPPGGSSADRVRVHLVGMAPFPRNDGGHAPVIPYAVPLLAGGNENVGIAIPPGREEMWRLGYTATGGDGAMNAGQFADYDQRWRGLPWRLEPDEHWRLVYHIVADGRPDVEFSIVIADEGGRIRCDLDG
jgi:hypothetical protein